MSFLLDTNVVSEPRRKLPDARVRAWLRSADPAGLFLSVLTLGEIAKGIEALVSREPARAEALRDWLAGLRDHFSDRILPVDAAVAETWGRLSSARPLPVVDGLIAATALTHGFTLVTRNLRDVEGTGVRVINPWE